MVILLFQTKWEYCLHRSFVFNNVMKNGLFILANGSSTGVEHSTRILEIEGLDPTTNTRNTFKQLIKLKAHGNLSTH